MTQLSLRHPYPRRRRARSAGVAAATLGAVLAMVAAHPGAAATATGADSAQLPKAPALQSAPVSVTLVTGDQVQLRRTTDQTWNVADIVPAQRAGSAEVAFQTLSTDGHTYVLPSDAMDSLAKDLVDIALFDVAYLADNGYTDELTESVPVIVQYAEQTARRSVQSQSVELPASTPGPTLESIDARAVDVTKADAASFWAAVTAQPERSARTQAVGNVKKLWLDARVNVALEDSVPQVGAPEAWAAGYDGTGVTVGVLDTGIDAGHPDLADKIVGSQTFIAGAEVTDGHGHGTHVASTIAGTGAASDGMRQGVAPDADLLIGKVLNDNGSGSASGIIDGMEWAAQEGADIISMSLGGSVTDGTDILSTAVNELSAGGGPLFVIAAGNSGPTAGTVAAPGAAESALTVAAVDKSDAMAEFSSRGPRIGDLGLKPDIAAPGVAIGAARAEGTVLGSPIDEFYTRANGTSMATPHVAGAAAILAEQHPDWTSAQLKDALSSTAVDLGAGVFAQGSGRLDIARAVDQEVFASDSVSFGHLPFPATEPVTKTITYTNPTDTSVTLNLSDNISSYGGEPAPDNALTLDAGEVVVPANGSAEVVATIDASSGALSGLVSGSITAADSSGAIQLRTRVGVFVEPKSFDLTVDAIAPDGATNVEADGWIVIRNGGWIDFATNSVQLAGDLTTTTRLPEGSYTVAGSFTWDGPDGGNEAIVMDPNVAVNADTTASFDLADAPDVAAEASEPTERFSSWFGFELAAPDKSWTLRGDVFAGYTPTRSRMLLTEPVESGSFDFASHHVLGPPLATLKTTGEDELNLKARYQSPDVRVPKLATDRDLPVSYAGRGLLEDFAGMDADGKLVLLTPTDLCSDVCDDAIADRVANADAAGAAGVLIAAAEGNVTLAGLAEDTFSIPTLSVPADLAARLVDRLDDGRRVSVHVDGEPEVPHLFYLDFPEQGDLPDDLTYQVESNELARVNHHLHADSARAGEPRRLFVMTTHPANELMYHTARTPYVASQRTLPIYSGPRSTMLYRIQLNSLPERAQLNGGFLEGTYARFEDRRYDIDWDTGPILPGPAETGLTPDNDPTAEWLCSACREGNVFLSAIALQRGAGHFSGYAGTLEGGPVTPNAHMCRPEDPENPPAGTPRYQCWIHMYDEDGNEIEQTILYPPTSPIGLSQEGASDDR